MVLPKNTAAQDAKKDQGLLSKNQVDEKIKESTKALKERESMWSKVAAAKSPSDYKALIDEHTESDCLLELLETDNARTSILTSARLSPAYYLKLKKIMDSEDTDLRLILAEMIDLKYNKLSK